MYGPDVEGTLYGLLASVGTPRLVADRVLSLSASCIFSEMHRVNLSIEKNPRWVSLC
jgi:hypothetical protein